MSGGDEAPFRPNGRQASSFEALHPPVRDRPEIVLADAGYWSNSHIDALRERGMTPIVAPDTTRNRPRKTRLGGPYDFMRRVMATEKGDGLYKRRQCMVEPVFAQIADSLDIALLGLIAQLTRSSAQLVRAPFAGPEPFLNRGRQPAILIT